MTSDTSFGSTLARSSAAFIAAVPKSWAGSVANAPLKEPTGVRAPEAMTTSVMVIIPFIYPSIVMPRQHGSVNGKNVASQKHSGQRHRAGVVFNPNEPRGYPLNLPIEEPA